MFQPVSQFIDFVRACKKLGMDNSNLSAAIECTNLKAPGKIVISYVGCDMRNLVFGISNEVIL